MVYTKSDLESVELVGCVKERKRDTEREGAVHLLFGIPSVVDIAWRLNE
jgi:hypothetical protein